MVVSQIQPWNIRSLTAVFNQIQVGKLRGKRTAELVSIERQVHDVLEVSDPGRQFSFDIGIENPEVLQFLEIEDVLGQSPVHGDYSGHLVFIETGNGEGLEVCQFPESNLERAACIEGPKGQCLQIVKTKKLFGKVGVYSGGKNAFQALQFSDSRRNGHHMTLDELLFVSSYRFLIPLRPDAKAQFFQIREIEYRVQVGDETYRLIKMERPQFLKVSQFCRECSVQTVEAEVKSDNPLRFRVCRYAVPFRQRFVRAPVCVIQPVCTICCVI